MYQVRDIVNEKFFQHLKFELRAVFGLEIKDIDQLFALKNLPLKDKDRINEIKSHIMQVAAEDGYNYYYMMELYQFYLAAIKNIQTNNKKIIIDENLYSHPLQKSIFTSYFKDYTIICLYSTLNELLAKSIIRNDKYILFVKGRSTANIASITKNIEISSNSSDFNFRRPIKIIDSFSKFFRFVNYSRSLESNEVIDSISKADLLGVINEIIEAERRYKQEFSTIGHYYSSEKQIDILAMQEKFIQKLGLDLSYDQFYVLPNQSFDYIIPTSSLNNSSNSFDIKKIEELLVKISSALY